MYKTEISMSGLLTVFTRRVKNLLASVWACGSGLKNLVAWKANSCRNSDIYIRF